MASSLCSPPGSQEQQPPAAMKNETTNRSLKLLQESMRSKHPPTYMQMFDTSLQHTITRPQTQLPNSQKGSTQQCLWRLVSPGIVGEANEKNRTRENASCGQLQHLQISESNRKGALSIKFTEHRNESAISNLYLEPLRRTLFGSFQTSDSFIWNLQISYVYVICLSIELLSGTLKLYVEAYLKALCGSF